MQYLVWIYGTCSTVSRKNSRKIMSVKIHIHPPILSFCLIISDYMVNIFSGGCEICMEMGKVTLKSGVYFDQQQNWAQSIKNTQPIDVFLAHFCTQTPISFSLTRPWANSTSRVSSNMRSSCVVKTHPWSLLATITSFEP